MDSIANYVTGVGSLDDSSVHGRPTLQNRLTDAELDILYLSDDLTQRIVDELVNDAVRTGWKATFKESDEEIEVPKHLNIAEAIRDAGKAARIQGGALIVATDSTGAVATEYTGGKVDITNLLIVDSREAYPRDWQTDSRKPYYGSPEIYSVSASIPQSAESMPVVHASRTAIFTGVKLPRRMRDNLFDGWGDSIMQAVWDAVRNFHQTEGAMASIVQRFEITTIGIAGLSQVLAEQDGEDLLLKRMRIMQKSMSMLSAALIDTDAGEQYDRQYATLTGLDAIWDRLALSVAKAAKKPMTQLFGTSPAGLGANDESGRANWRKQIAAYQEDQVLPALLWFYQMLTGRDDIIIEFNPLEEETAAQAAQIVKARAEARAIYSKHGLLSPEEIRPALKDEGILARSAPDKPPEEEEAMAQLPMGSELPEPGNGAVEGNNMTPGKPQTAEEQGPTG